MNENYHNQLKIFSEHFNQALKKARKIKISTILFLYAIFGAGIFRSARNNELDYDFLISSFGLFCFFTLFALIIMLIKIRTFVPRNQLNKLMNKHRYDLVKVFLDDLNELNYYHPLKKKNAKDIAKSQLYKYSDLNTFDYIELKSDKAEISITRAKLLKGIMPVFNGIFIHIYSKHLIDNLKEIITDSFPKNTLT